MELTLETVDKVAGLPKTQGPSLTFSLDRVTPREIVRARVRAECGRIAAGGSIFAPLVPATARESLLNGPRVSKRAPEDPDVEAQIALALEAVESGRVIVLVNGAQIHDLDAPVPISPYGEVTFLRLVPLAGG
jgi:hypothetical protein